MDLLLFTQEQTAYRHHPHLLGPVNGHLSPGPENQGDSEKWAQAIAIYILLVWCGRLSSISRPCLGVRWEEEDKLITYSGLGVDVEGKAAVR